MKKNGKEAVMYVVFGVLTTAVNYGVYILFNAILGEKLYQVSNVIAWIFAVAFAYVSNKLFVFESKSWEKRLVLREITSFTAARLLSLGVEALGLFIMVDLCHMQGDMLSVFGFTLTGENIAKLIMAVVVIVMNYVFSKLVIFKKKSKE